MNLRTSLCDASRWSSVSADQDHMIEVVTRFMIFASLVVVLVCAFVRLSTFSVASIKWLLIYLPVILEMFFVSIARHFYSVIGVSYRACHRLVKFMRLVVEERSEECRTSDACDRESWMLKKTKSRKAG